MQITRLIVRRLLDELKQALIDAIVETLKEPAISAIEAIVTDLIRQSVNVGFGAQEGYDVGATLKAGGQAGLDALRQSPQTFAEGLRDSLGEKAGSRARDAIDSRIDGYDATPGLSGGGSGSAPGRGVPAPRPPTPLRPTPRRPTPLPPARVRRDRTPPPRRAPATATAPA